MELQGEKEESILQDKVKQLKDDKLQLCKTKMEEKSRFGNLVRFMNKQRREFEDDQKIHRRKEQAALNEYRHDQENELARELSMIKSEEIRQLKLRQQLRENSHELRDLERKLKAAYINKELAAQIAQKEAEKLNEKIQEKRAHNLLEEAQLREVELKRKLAEEDMIKKAQYKQELQEQIILGEESKRYLYEEYLREKKMIDDVIQRIHDEDEREIQEKMCKMKKTREEMMAFKAARDEWKERKKRDIEEENRRIQEFLQQKTAASSARAAEKKRREEIKAKIQENLARQVHADRMRIKEREDIIRELTIEEQKEEQERRHTQEMENKIRRRLEIREALATQLKEKEARLRDEAAQDAEYKEQILQQLAEDQKLEQMSAQKRRMKMLQLRRESEQIMTERRQKRAEEMKMMIKLKEQEDQELENRRKIVEEERISLLKEHVKNLVGYLPKGLLKPDDLPHLGSDIVDKNKDQPC